MKKTNRMLSMLLAVIMVVCMLPVSVFAAEPCSCVDRCDSLHIMDSGCPVCTASGNVADCMGTPILQVNGGVYRYSETEAEIGFMASVNETVEWNYYYLITNNSSDTPSAETIIAEGKSGVYSDPHTLIVNDLAEGEKYIHIVLHQEEQDRTTNVLNLTIPEYIPLTIIPSAEGYELESGNTLTVVTGTTVTFTTSESGCGMEYKEGTTKGPALEFVGNEIDGYEGYSRTATFSELGTYSIVASINYKTAECTVVVVDELHQHTYSSEWSSDVEGHWHSCSCGAASDFAEHASSGAASYGVPETCTVCGYEIAPAKTTYSLTVNYEIYASNGAIIGSGIESRTVEFAPDTVVDLSEYWPEQMTSVGNDGTTYYFRGFSYAADGGGNNYNAVTVSENTVIYATWVRQNMVTVEFDTLGGEMSYKKVKAGTTYRIFNMNSLHMPVRSGYDFVGWSRANDGTADPDDMRIRADCTLYAVWRTVEYFGDDDYDPLPDGLPVYIGGNTDAVRISDGAIGKIIDNGNEVVVRFPDGTSGTLTDSALVAVKDNLQDGESLQIAVKNAGSEVLPDSLTEKGAYGGVEANIDKGFFVDAGITEERLMALGLINNSNDSSISEEEFEYLYHYLTTDELKALKTELNEGAALFEHHQKAVDWLTKMIERDATVVDMSNGQLSISDILSKLEEIGYMGGDFTLGFLRQADLDMEHLEYIRSLMQQFVDDFDDSADELVLAWANEAIAQKEFEATCVQMNALLEEAKSTQGSYTGLNDVKAAAKDMTTYELKLFLKKANAAKNTESGTIPVLALGAIDSIIEFLNSELKAREASNTPKYVQVGGTPDGINPLFIGAVEVNIGAVKVDGTTTPIALKAGTANAFEWTTTVNVSKLLMDSADWDVNNIRAYKVLEDNTLEARGVKVVQNANGTLTLKALSDGNSAYVFLYEPAKADVDDTPTTPEIPDSPQTGDNSHMWLWVALLFVSGAGLVGTTIYGRKRRTN